MEHNVALLLAKEGYSEIEKTFFSNANIEWIRKILSCRNVNFAIKNNPLSEENNKELLQLFQTMSMSYFFAKLRSIVFRGNFVYAKLRMDIKVSTQLCKQMTDVCFIMEVCTTEGKKTVRLSLAMINKLVSELSKCANQMRRIQMNVQPSQ